MTTPAVELRMDLFPALLSVISPNGVEKTHNTARLLIGLDEIWAWEMNNGEAVLVLNDRYETIGGGRTIGWTATLSDGSTLNFRRGDGCGCGNPLRGWSPPFMIVQGARL